MTTTTPSGLTFFFFLLIPARVPEIFFLAPMVMLKAGFFSSCTLMLVKGS